MTTLNPRRNQRLSLNKNRWAAYATAGAATALASAPSAEAEITFVSVNQVFNATPGGSVSAPFQLGPNASFALFHSRIGFANNAASGQAGFLIYAVGNNAFNGFAGFTVTTTGAMQQLRYVSNLDAGQNVGGLASFAQPPLNIFGTLAVAPGYVNSQWDLAENNRFIAFRFDTGAGPQLGWARINFDGPNNNSFTLVDYAFGGPNEAIATGQIPEPGSLGLIALGAVGIIAWRRRRAQVAPQA